MPHPDLSLTAAYCSLGLADTGQLVDAAHAALDGGVYSYSLGELATARDPSWANCHPLFLASLRELGLAVPDHPTAVRTLVDHHAARLAEGVGDPEEVLGELHSVEQALSYERPARVARTVRTPLQPFVDLYYAVNYYREEEAYRSAEGTAGPHGSLPDDLLGECVALARGWCRTRWGPVLDPAWLTATVIDIAQAIDIERAFDRLPILADALEEAGCREIDILDHCRGAGLHVRGCWVVDLLLGRGRLER